MAIAAVLVIEIAYDLVLQAVYVKSLVDIATGRESGWNTSPARRPPDDCPWHPAAQDSVLQSGWVQTLTVFVAVDALVYAGLCVAELIPRRRG